MIGCTERRRPARADGIAGEGRPGLRKVGTA
jgi:hypothetical protein